MLNKEKFAEEIIEIACTGSRVAAVDGKPKKCKGLSCFTCDFRDFHCECEDRIRAWANSEYVEPQVDWSKVPIDTPILVKPIECDAWARRYFAGLHDGWVCAWDNGTTSWSTWSQESGYSSWKYAKLAESEE